MSGHTKQSMYLQSCTIKENPPDKRKRLRSFWTANTTLEQHTGCMHGRRNLCKSEPTKLLAGQQSRTTQVMQRRRQLGGCGGGNKSREWPVFVVIFRASFARLTALATRDARPRPGGGAETANRPICFVDRHYSPSPTYSSLLLLVFLMHLAVHACDSIVTTSQFELDTSVVKSMMHFAQPMKPDLRHSNLALPMGSAHSSSRKTHPTAADNGRPTVTVRTKQGAFVGAVHNGGGPVVASSHNSTSGDYRPNLPLPDGPMATDSSAVVSFLGIRYASAPVKRLRFMPPTPFQYAASQVHSALEFGPICMQRLPVDVGITPFGNGLQTSASDAGIRNPSHGRYQYDSQASSTEAKLRLLARMVPEPAFRRLKPTFRQLVEREQSEDCLNLNIYTPLSALREHLETGRAKPKPVLVIIHGESFDFGSGSTVNGLQFVQQNPHQLVITFNYRLNILGFPPKIAGSANLGLLDQVAALHWVRDNVAAFGGVPGNVTLMGAGQGAIFVGLLMVSPLAGGLFQRAIMEDGSPVSPLVAAARAPAGAGHASAAHVRLLARLCDCTAPSGRLAPPDADGADSGRPGHQAMPASSHQQQQQQQQQQQHLQPPSSAGSGFLNSSTDESPKSLALALECLRHKPLELLMQRVPLDLLLLEPNSAELGLAPQWLRRAHQHQPRRLGLLVAGGGGGGGGRLEPAQFRRLVTELTSELAARPAALSERPEVAQVRQAGPKSALGGEEAKLSDEPVVDYEGELFHALHASGPAWSAAPLFGPSLDGATLPGEELASAMLGQAGQLPTLAPGATQAKGGATAHFARADLLIGWSKARNELHHQLASPAPTPAARHASNGGGGGGDSALELVNTFVRSFYRYHQQEIANSIINNYLANGGQLYELQAQQQRHHSSPGYNAAEGAADESAAAGGGANRSVAAAALQQRRLVELAERAIQDALVLVPLLKTALIHATRQLEGLSDLFVVEQARRQSRLDLEPANQAGQLSGAFGAFARSLYQNDWVQGGATYLYELAEPAWLAGAVRGLLSSNNQPLQAEQRAWPALVEALQALQVSLATHGHPVSLGCALEPEAELEPAELDATSWLNAGLRNWLCARLSGLVASFVVSGNVNGRNQHILPASSAATASLEQRLASFEQSCMSSESTESTETASSSTTTTTNSTEPLQCKRELAELALSWLTQRLAASPSGPNSAPARWPPFELFTQQAVSLPALLLEGGAAAVAGTPPAEGNQEQQPRGPQSGLAAVSSRASFWANFVGALNCTRTQPILPASLLGASSNASALLGLNLASSCHAGNARTARDHMDLLASSLGPRVEERSSQLRAAAAAAAAAHAAQRDHSTRGANQHQAQVELGETVAAGPQTAAVGEPAPQQPAGRELDGGAVGSTRSLAPGSQHEFGGPHFRSGAALLVLTAAGACVSLTLASGACVLLQARRRRRRQRLASTNGAQQAEALQAQLPLQLPLQQPQQQQHQQQQQQQYQHQQLEQQYQQQLSPPPPHALHGQPEAHYLWQPTSEQASEPEPPASLSSSLQQAIPATQVRLNNRSHSNTNTTKKRVKIRDPSQHMTVENEELKLAASAYLGACPVHGSEPASHASVTTSDDAYFMAAAQTSPAPSASQLGQLWSATTSSQEPAAELQLTSHGWLLDERHQAHHFIPLLAGGHPLTHAHSHLLLADQHHHSQAAGDEPAAGHCPRHLHSFNSLSRH